MVAAAQAIAVNGTEFAVEPGAVVTIGRDLASDVAIDDPSVSRHHATLTSEARGWVFRDLGSANGSHLDGGRVAELVVRRSLTLRLGGAHDGVPIDLTLVGTPPVASVDAAQGDATVITAAWPPIGDAAAVATVPSPAAEVPVPAAADTGLRMLGRFDRDGNDTVLRNGSLEYLSEAACTFSFTGKRTA